MTAGISITINLPGVAASGDDLEAAGVSVQHADAAPPPPVMDDAEDAADFSDVAAGPPNVEGDAGFDQDPADGFAPPPDEAAGDDALTADDDGEPPPPDDDAGAAPAATRSAGKTTTRGRRKKA